MFHLTTGRLYVGQPITHVWKRAQRQFWDRRSLPDLFHKTLSEDSPLWCFAGGRVTRPLVAAGRTRKHAFARLQTKEGSTVSVASTRCGHVATTRRFQFPVGCSGEPVRFVECSEWFEKWKRDATAFLSELGKQSKPTIREVLGHLQRAQMQGDISVNELSPIPQPQGIELLRENKTEPPERQFLHVRFPPLTLEISGSRKSFATRPRSWRRSRLRHKYRPSFSTMPKSLAD